MKEHPKILEFIEHCCKSGHYSFNILKCGEAACNICAPIRLPREIFKKLRHIPFPILGDDGHYLPFAEVFTSEKRTQKNIDHHIKGLHSHYQRMKRKLPYYASVQHAKNAELMLQCSECELWQLIFSKYKFKKEERDQLEVLLNNFMHTCGATLKELDLPVVYEFVDVRDHERSNCLILLKYTWCKTPMCPPVASIISCNSWSI